MAPGAGTSLGEPVSWGDPGSGDGIQNEERSIMRELTPSSFCEHSIFVLYFELSLKIHSQKQD